MGRAKAAVVIACCLAGLSALAAAGCDRRKPDTAAGGQLFASNCARCHGMDGVGMAPLLAGSPSPRNFRDPEFQRTRTDEQIKMTIVNGRGTGMPAFGPAFDDAKLTALVAHVRSFDPGKGNKP